MTAAQHETPGRPRPDDRFRAEATRLGEARPLREALEKFGCEVARGDGRDFLVFENGAVPIDMINWLSQGEDGKVHVAISRGDVLRLKPKAVTG